MMQAKEKLEKPENSEQLEKKGALNTEEILSLLSKTSQDFKKETDISQKFTNLFKKSELKDLVEKSNQNENLESENDSKIEQTKEEIVDEEEPEAKIEEKKIEEEKKYTEKEAKNLANELAKQHYEKGYNLGIKKTKEELEKGEKALAVALKNTTDNLFSIGPDFVKKINESINDLLLKISREILGYEIDTKTEYFSKKVMQLVDSIENSVKKAKVFLNKQDFEAIKKFLSESDVKMNIEFLTDEKLHRGDIRIKSGSIEIGELLSNKVNFSQTENMKKELSDLNIHNEKLIKSENETSKVVAKAANPENEAATQNETAKVANRENETAKVAATQNETEKSQNPK